MLAAGVCKRALEELSELLVGRLERRIREVDIGHESHHTPSRKHRARTRNMPDPVGCPSSPRTGGRSAACRRGRSRPRPPAPPQRPRRPRSRTAAPSGPGGRHPRPLSGARTRSLEARALLVARHRRYMTTRPRAFGLRVGSRVVYRTVGTMDFDFGATYLS